METIPFSPDQISLDAVPVWLIAVVISCATLIYAGLWAVICGFLSANLSALPEARRRIGKGALWLLLIPLFNAWWLFRVTAGLVDSWRDHLAALGRPAPGESARKAGLWWAIVNALCTLAQFIPNTVVQIVALLGSLAFLVLLVAFLVLLNDLRLKAATDAA